MGIVAVAVRTVGLDGLADDSASQPIALLGRFELARLAKFLRAPPTGICGVGPPMADRFEIAREIVEILLKIPAHRHAVPAIGGDPEQRTLEVEIGGLRNPMLS